MLLAVAYVFLECQLPDIAQLKDVHLQTPLRIYTSDHELIAEYGSKHRIPVALSQVPPSLIHAVLATEDARFYSHPGIDWIGLLRATKAVLLTGHKVQGASTITMQVARNFFLSSRKTYLRKIREILLALKIDRTFSKDTVLELYLNKVYFGHRAYGVAAAGQIYYGKPLDKLSLAQIAMIAGLPQAPSHNNPLIYPKRALSRRNHVLHRLFSLGLIDATTYRHTLKIPITARHHGSVVTVSAPYLAEMVRQHLVNQYGKLTYERGFSVITTIRAKNQNAARRALHKGLLAYAKRHRIYSVYAHWGTPNLTQLPHWQHKLERLGTVNHLHPAVLLTVAPKRIEALLADGRIRDLTPPAWGQLPFQKTHQTHTLPITFREGDVVWLLPVHSGWHFTQIPRVQGAIVSLNPQNGAVLALSGGFNYRLSPFNRVTQSVRQPGSLFKPFVYSAALSKGFTLASVINDAPIVVSDSGENQWWRPENDTLRFYGPTRLRVGLRRSRNLVSIRLLQAIGLPYMLQYSQRFGFEVDKLPSGLSLALGSASVTPWQMAGAYALFANGGYRIEPYYIDRILDAHNRPLFTARPAHACPACMTHKENALTIPLPTASETITAQNAYLINQAMQDVIQRGTGRAARALKRQDLAGKTGTTNKKYDAWFAGFNSDVLAVVWVGFDHLQSLHEYGAQAALPIWMNYMRLALTHQPEHSMPEPPGLIRVRIDPKTGLLACSNQKQAIFELFRTDHQPTQWATAPPEHGASGANPPSDSTQQSTKAKTDLFSPEDTLF